MADWSQSFFLQALGWATLNSFWQMGLLWCGYLLIIQLFRLSSHQKFLFSVSSIAAGFAWFILSFFNFKQTNGLLSSMVETTVSASYLQVFLISASVTYLALLVFPAYKLLRNWNFVRRIRQQGLEKAALPCRLFVQKISAQLNLKNRVSVFVSSLVHSPVTVGYFKPVILLPLSALSQLSPLQVEAILLHELSHIRRADYLLNFLISIVHTILYFNPFVKLFVQQIDAERENCCDEMVLQFGYDKVAYCSALLTLEKTAGQRRTLALGATGKKNLLSRIEKMVGMEKKKRYNLAQLIPAFAAIVCLLAFNSVLVLHDANKAQDMALTSSTAFNPFYLMESGKTKKAEINATPSTVPIEQQPSLAKATQVTTETQQPVAAAPEIVSIEIPPAPVQPMPGVIHVAADEVEASLTDQQKEQVTATIDATKQILITLQWQQVESSMADALNEGEKELVKDAYNRQLAAVNWQNIEKNLKANYEKIDWTAVNMDMAKALTEIELAKLEKKQEVFLEQLQKLEKEICTSETADCVLLPDASLKEIKQAQEEVRRNLQEIRAAKDKKIIRL
ncbi:MAG: M56 family metallopeptidase [Flavisolibacter sp.]